MPTPPDMPMPATADSPYVFQKTSQALPWLTWRYSLIFAVALLGVVASIIYSVATDDGSSTSEIVFRVVDQNDAPVSGATVRVGELEQSTGENGEATIKGLTGSQPVVITREGFSTEDGIIDPAEGSRRQVRLVPVAAAADAANAGASNVESDTAVVAVDPTIAPTDVPAVAVTSPVADVDTSSSPAAASAGSPGSPETTLSGKILAEDGTPIQGARVVSGAEWKITGADGIYNFARAKIDGSRPLQFFASGFLDQAVEVPAGIDPLDVTLEIFMVKGIYYNPNIASTPADLDRLINIATTTEINAIVIDIKEELVFYDTQVKFFRDAGTVSPVLDIQALLARMQENNIYTIARLVVFKDSIVAEERPDLAVRSTETGKAWRDQNDVAWVNPTEQELWEANADLAVEAANLGFDEIQYDYVRFPTDGDLSTMDFGSDFNQKTREDAIGGFMQLSHAKLIPTGAKLSADVFGYTLLVSDDLGIGQNVAKLAPDLDFLSPMVYPSHYGENFQGYIPPNDFPGEVVGISMEAGRNLLGGDASKLRPWLQDFDYFGDVKPYNAPEVRAQIDATEEVGASGWLLWDPNNEYTIDALKPDSGTTRNDPALMTPIVARLAEGSAMKSTGRRPMNRI